MPLPPGSGGTKLPPSSVCPQKLISRTPGKELLFAEPPPRDFAEPSACIVLLIP